MDLRHHILVWFRWRAILAAGLVLAVILGILVSFKPALSGSGVDLKWRSKAVYTTKSRLLVTQPGFPIGRTTLPGVVEGQNGAAQTTTQQQSTNDSGKVDFADPSRFSYLAIVYSYLAQSEPVRARIHPKPAPDDLSVVYQGTQNGDALPLLELTTKGNSPAAVQQLNFKAIQALRGYLDQQLTEAGVPEAQRVSLQTLNPPDLGSLSSGRTPTVSAVVFILVLVGTLLLVYILENLYPRGLPRAAVWLEDRPAWRRVAGERSESGEKTSSSAG
jgi:hypothetical protein